MELYMSVCSQCGLGLGCVEENVATVKTISCSSGRLGYVVMHCETCELFIPDT